MEYRVIITDVTRGIVDIVNKQGERFPDALLIAYFDEIDCIESYEELIDALMEDSSHAKAFRSESTSLVVQGDVVRVGYTQIRGVVSDQPKDLILYFALQRYGQVSVLEKM